MYRPANNSSRSKHSRLLHNHLSGNRPGDHTLHGRKTRPGRTKTGTTGSNRPLRHAVHQPKKLFTQPARPRPKHRAQRNQQDQRPKGQREECHRATALVVQRPATPGTYDCHTGSIPCGGQAAGDCHRSQEEGRSGAADACKVGRCLEYEDSHFQASQSSDPTRRCQNCSFMETIPGVCDRDVAFFHRGLRQGGQTLGRAHWESRCRSFNGSAQDSLNEAKKAATEEELKDQIETIEDEDEGLDRTTKSSQVMREGLTDRHVGRPGAAPCQNGGNWRRSRKQTPKGGRWQIQVICHAAFWWGRSLGQEVSGHGQLSHVAPFWSGVIRASLKATFWAHGKQWKTQRRSHSNLGVGRSCDCAHRFLYHELEQDCPQLIRNRVCLLMNALRSPSFLQMMMKPLPDATLWLCVRLLLGVPLMENHGVAESSAKQKDLCDALQWPFAQLCTSDAWHSHFLMDYVDKMPPMDRITKMILTSSLTQLEPRNSSMTFLKELNSMEHFLISTEMAPCALEPGIFITNMNIIVNIHACLNLKRTGDEWELDSGLAWRGHSCDSSWSVQRLPTSTSPCWCSDDFPRTLDASVFNIVNHSSPTSATPSFFVRSCMLTSTTVWRSCVGICCERFVLVSSTQPSLQNEPCVERYSIHGCAHTWSPPWPSLYHYNFGLHACCQHCKLIVHTNGCAATSWDWRLLPHAHCPGGWQHWHGGWATAIARRLWKQQRTQRGHQHSDLPPGWTRCALLCIKQDVHVHLGGGHPCKPNEKERCQMFSLCPGDPSWRSRDSRGSHHPPVSQRQSTWLCRKTCTTRSWNTFPPTTWTTFGAGSYQQEGSQGQSKFT